MKTLNLLLARLAVLATGLSTAFAGGTPSSIRAEHPSALHLSDNAAFGLFMFGIVAIGVWSGRRAMQPKR